MADTPVSRSTTDPSSTSEPHESIDLTFPEGTEDASSKMVMPGDNTEMVVTMGHPNAIEVGQRFNIREGGRTVATGLCTRILK